MRPMEEPQPTTPSTTSTTSSAEDVDRLGLRYGFWIIITGFALVFLITLISSFRWAEVTSVATVVGAVARAWWARWWRWARRRPKLSASAPKRG
jgi:hypothetical protein